MLTFNDNNYEPISIDSDIFLSEIPIELMKESIMGQFEEPLENTVDYITIFIDRYKYSESMCDEALQHQLHELRDDFIIFMVNLFREYLGIGIPDLEDMGDDDQFEIISIVYQFFIRNIKKNFTHVVLNYIDRYKKSLSEITSKRKDVTTLSFKKEVNNIEDLNIIANLSDIVDFIISADCDVSEFLSLVKPSLDTSLLAQAIDEYRVTGNFVDKYRRMVDVEFKRDIESKVRNKILKKYKKSSI